MPPTDFVDQLERLSRLRADGHITEVQFETAKAQILEGRPGQEASTPSQPSVIRPTTRLNGYIVIAGGALFAIVAIALLVWLMLPPTTPVGVPSGGNHTTVAALPTIVAPTEPALPPLSPGETLSWSADKNLVDVERQVGPLRLRIGKAGSGDEVGPSVEVHYGDATVRMEGERVSPTYEHRVTAFVNRVGATPVVMLQSFSGGAHCCNHVQVAGLSGGQLRLIDLGAWDGDYIDPPRDVSGDGVADFVFSDQAFLYAFAPYAMSDAPPKVVNLIGGRRVDVSGRPAFRHLFVDAMKRSGENCRNGSDGDTRNGACAAYVAAAARAGQLPRAWTEMLAAYDATVDWTMPTGCTVAAGSAGCPMAQQISYQSYPEALLAFLKREGYISPGWQPPAPVSPAEPGPAPDDMM